MNAFLVLVLSSIYLVGCGTTPDSLKKTQSTSYASNRSAIDVTVCVSDGWEKLHLFLNNRPIKDGFRVQVMNQDHAYYMAEITNISSGGSITQYWISSYAWSGSQRDRATSVIQSCQ